MSGPMQERSGDTPAASASEQPQHAVQQATPPQDGVNLQMMHHQMPAPMLASYFPQPVQYMYPHGHYQPMAAAAATHPGWSVQTYGPRYEPYGATSRKEEQGPAKKRPSRLSLGKRPVGRPRKSVPKPDSDDEVDVPAEAAAPSEGCVKLPVRCDKDVSICAEGGREACARCGFWKGRYILRPCFHYGFCINCLEELHNCQSAAGLKDVCPACEVPITEYFPGTYSSIHDVDLDHE